MDRPSSFPRYPEYKPSGVDWLGEVPATWEVKRLRFAAQINPAKSEIAREPRDAEVSFLPMEAVGDDGSLNLERTRPIGEVETGYTYFREGDVTVAKITPCFENGKGAVMRGLVGGFGFGTTELTVARPRVGLTSSEYLHWLFSSSPFRSLGEASMYGAGGQKRVPEDFFRDFAIGLPALAEQTAIAAFLDRETAKIDALVAEQEKLIALLKEKRQAVISHAVTKGLNPDAPMKPSGIEWLGDVPAHWEVRRLKTISPQITVGIVVEPSKYYVEKGVPALRSLNVRPGSVSVDGMVYISESANELLAKSKLRAGDLVAVRSGQPGTTAVVPVELDGCNCIDLIVIRRPTSGSEAFLCWYLNSESAIHQFSEGSGGAIQQHFNVETATTLLIPWPPELEQRSIVEQLSASSTQLDALVCEAERAITLLKERRSALISAAVTGQIDVRDALAETRHD